MRLQMVLLAAAAAFSAGAAQAASVEIKLISPIACEEGLRFAIREGGRTVGAGVVTKILADTPKTAAK